MIICAISIFIICLSVIFLLIENKKEEKRIIIILEILDSDRDKWWFGQQIINASDKELVAGFVYVYLGKMLNQGLVESKNEVFTDCKLNGLPRNLYRITTKGTHLKVKSSEKSSFTFPFLSKKPKPVARSKS
mgnify:CR=1 FL=1